MDDKFCLYFTLNYLVRVGECHCFFALHQLKCTVLSVGRNVLGKLAANRIRLTCCTRNGKPSFELTQMNEIDYATVLYVKMGRPIALRDSPETDRWRCRASSVSAIRLTSYRAGCTVKDSNETLMFSATCAFFLFCFIHCCFIRVIKCKYEGICTNQP